MSLVHGDKKMSLNLLNGIQSEVKKKEKLLLCLLDDISGQIDSCLVSK